MVEGGETNRNTGLHVDGVAVLSVAVVDQLLGGAADGGAVRIDQHLAKGLDNEVCLGVCQAAVNDVGKPSARL